MDIEALTTFQAIARAGSITAGARARGSSQSTASNHLASLEEELGTTLFLRTRAGVELTEAGALLLERADEVFTRLDQITSDIHDLQSGDVGSFVLGCHDALGGYFLPTFLPGFLREHPRIHVRLSNRTSAEVRQEVLDRQAHFGLVVNTEPHDDLVIVDAFADRIALFGHQPCSLEELRARAGDSLLAYPDRPPFTWLLGKLEALGVRFERTIPCGDLGLTRSFGDTVDFALLPARVASGNALLRLVSPELPHHDDAIHLVYRADLHRTRAAQKLRTALLEHARSLNG